MRRGALAAIAGLALAAAAFAQQRSPSFVTVVDAEGKPLANAEVTCVFTPNLVNPWPRDIVTATTDARGRARCDLLGSRLYSVWAVGARDANGIALATDVMLFFAAGYVRELVAREPRRARQIRLGGLAAWREVGAVRVRWFPDDFDGPWRDLDWPSTDTIEIPPSPYATGGIGLVDAKGVVLVAIEVPTDLGDVAPLPAPVLVVARVVDDGGKPIAGATIFGEPSPRRGMWPSFLRIAAPDGMQQPVGRTDADGVLRFHAPERRSVVVSATAPERAIVSKAIDGADDLRFTLAAAAPAHIELAGLSDTDRVTCGVIVYANVRTATGGMTFVQHMLGPAREAPDVWRVETGGLPFLPCLALPGSPPTAVIYTGVLSQACTVALNTLRRVEVFVTDPKGGPVQCAIGVMYPGAQVPFFRWRALMPTDTAGRAVLYLTNGDFVVYATDGVQHAIGSASAARPGKLEMTLEAIPTMRVRVLDGAGQPVAGARAVPHDCSDNWPNGDDDRVRWLHAANHLWSCYVGGARSDVNGVMQVPAFVRPGLQANVVVRAQARESATFALTPEGDATVTIK